MYKYAQVADDETKICNVALGDDEEFYKSIGMELLDVEQSSNGEWYLSGYSPTPTLEYLKNLKLQEVDTWTKNKIIGGFTSSCTGELVKYDSDTETQITMQGIALNVNTELFATNYPKGCPVRGYPQGSDTKQIYYLSPEQVLRWQADLSMHIGTCKQEGWVKQAEVENAQSKEELDAIVLD